MKSPGRSRENARRPGLPMLYRSFPASAAHPYPRVDPDGQFNGTLQLIFQPAEELLYGGRVMVEDGLFTKFPCDAIFGLHNMPGQKLGKIARYSAAYSSVVV
jgi:metal-dependent amidase/aminoacylase/carboxypeptidase family protein